MAKKGVRVLILEKETQFKDRVRGEYIVTWGVAEAKEVGIETALLNSCGTVIPFIEMGYGPRNLIETTALQLAGVSSFISKPLSVLASSPSLILSSLLSRFSSSASNAVD